MTSPQAAPPPVGDVPSGGAPAAPPPGRRHRLALLSLGLVVAAAGALWVGRWVFYQVRARQAFSRDDAGALRDDETGLKRAYEALRQNGYRVALARDDGVPHAGEAWWVLQASTEWFHDGEKHGAALREYAEHGGTVVFAPAEDVTWPDDDSKSTAPSEEELERVFRALGLDVRLLTFEAPEPGAGEEDDDAIADEGDEADPGIGYALPVSGTGPGFETLSEIETSWGNYWEGEGLLRGEIRLHSDGFPLIAEFKVGRGRIVLVAESTYFENEFMGEPRNVELLEAMAKNFGQSGIFFDAAGAGASPRQ